MNNSITQILENINSIGKFNKLLCLKQSQAAEILGVCSSTLEAWRREGIGPEYLKMGASGKKGRVMYPKTALAQWIVNKTIKTA